MDTGTNAALNISACRLLNRCVGISYLVIKAIASYCASTFREVMTYLTHVVKLS